MKNTSKKARRVLAMFLAMMMCLSMLNLTAFAEDGAGGNTAASEPAQAATDGAPSTAVTDTPVTNETPATQPTEAPKPAETAAPTAAPTAEGTAAPAPSASAAPSAAATETPAGEPTLAPSAQPTQQPADEGSDDAPDGAAPDAGTPGADEEKPADHEHTWEDGKCTDKECGLVCEHKEHTPEGKCAECGFECLHEKHSIKGICEVCGAECEHSYNNLKTPNYPCKVCGLCKKHKFSGGVCQYCAYECDEHDFSKGKKCAVCGMLCKHEDTVGEDGYCTQCKEVASTSVTVSTQKQFDAVFNKSSDVTQITLNGDFKFPKTCYKSVTIVGNGHTMKNGVELGKSSGICGALTLENVSVDGTIGQSGTYSGIKLTLNSGAYVKTITKTSVLELTMNAGSSVGTLSVKGGSFTLPAGTHANHVDVSSGATFTLDGGTISGGNVSNGGGVHNKGTFNMKSGTITNNTAKWGGGVKNEGVFAMSGGTITGNTSTGFGAGVHSTNSQFSVQGNATVTGNTKSGVENNVYIGSSQIIVAGPMGASANIGFNLSNAIEGATFARGEGVHSVTESDAKAFKLDADTEFVTALGEANTLVLTIPEDEPPVAEYSNADGDVVQTSLQKALNNVQAGRTVSLITNATVSKDISIPKDVVLDLAGHTLNLNGHHIVVPSGMSFTLDCPNGGMITGGGDSSTNGGAVEVNGAFIMNSGTLCGNTGLYGGAVYVASGGQFTMNGGTINGNTASNGGGIFVQTGAVAYVNAGKITNNTATCKAEEDESLYPYGGGGIYVNGGKSGKENGKLYLKNVAVTENKAGSGTADRPQFNAGAGLSACPTSNTKIYITSGGVIAGNLPGINGKPISQVFVDEGNDNSKHEVFLSKYALGGGVYNWTDAEGKPLVGAGEEVNLTNGGKVNAFSDLKVNLDVLGGIASVIISGNTSAYSGGGIGSNGDVIIGEDKAVLPIRKVVDGEGTPAQTEFKFDVTLTLGGAPYEGSVVLNGAEMNGDKSGKFILTLKAGETKVLTNMDAGVAYTITEQPSGASSVTVNNEKSNTISGTTQLESAGVAEIVFTNTYDASTPTPPPTNPPVVVIPTPTPTPTATPTPTPEPTEEPTPTPEPDEEIPDEDVPLGTPKPEPTPEPDEEIPDEDVPLGTPKPEPTPEPDEEIPDPDVPLGPSEPEPTPEPDEEIPDEDVPLANTPKTGDNADIWFLLSVISAAGLVFLGAAEWKKRKENHKA